MPGHKHLSPFRPFSAASRRGDRPRLLALPVRIALIGLFLTVAAAGSEDRARQIVERAAKRQGGGELAARGAIRSFHVELEVTKHDAGKEGMGAGTLIRTYRPPTDKRKALFRESWEDSGPTTHRGLGYDSDGVYRGWTRKGKKVTVLSVQQKETWLKLKEDAKQMGLLLRSFLLRNLLGDGVELSLEAKVKVGERIEWRVKRTVEGERPMILGIDEKTHDLMRVIIPATGKDAPERVFVFSLPKVFEGIRIPGKIVIRERSAKEREAKKPWRETTVAFVDDLKLNRREHGEAFFAVPAGK